jgi:hypothetical protein
MSDLELSVHMPFDIDCSVVLFSSVVSLLLIYTRSLSQPIDIHKPKRNRRNNQKVLSGQYMFKSRSALLDLSL